MKIKNTELLIMKEIGTQGIAVCLKPNSSQVISRSLVTELRHFQDSLANHYFSSPWEDYLYVVWYYHRRHGAGKLGLDFNFILKALKKNREQEVESYLTSLIDLLFLNYIGLGLPIVNCSLIDKKVSGVFQEFFLLNKINFIKHPDDDHAVKTISKVDVRDVAKNLTLSKSIYQNNFYYRCHGFDLKLMQGMIEKTELKSLDEKELAMIRQQFESMYQSTLARIYDLAANNPSLLKRVAHMQRNGEKA